MRNEVVILGLSMGLAACGGEPERTSNPPPPPMPKEVKASKTSNPPAVLPKGAKGKGKAKAKGKAGKAGTE